MCYNSHVMRKSSKEFQASLCLLAATLAACTPGIGGATPTRRVDVTPSGPTPVDVTTNRLTPQETTLPPVPEDDLTGKIVEEMLNEGLIPGWLPDTNNPNKPGFIADGTYKTSTGKAGGRGNLCITKPEGASYFDVQAVGDPTNGIERVTSFTWFDRDGKVVKEGRVHGQGDKLQVGEFISKNGQPFIVSSVSVCDQNYLNRLANDLRSCIK